MSRHSCSALARLGAAMEYSIVMGFNISAPAASTWRSASPSSSSGYSLSIGSNAILEPATGELCASPVAGANQMRHSSCAWLAISKPPWSYALIRAAQNLQRFRSQKAVRIGDDADSISRFHAFDRRWPAKIIRREPEAARLSRTRLIASYSLAKPMLSTCSARANRPDGACDTRWCIASLLGPHVESFMPE